MENLLLRPEEAARVLGLGRSKVYALLATGELPSIRIGGSIRVPTEKLREWLERKSSASSTDPTSAADAP